VASLRVTLDPRRSQLQLGPRSHEDEQALGLHPYVCTGTGERLPGHAPQREHVRAGVALDGAPLAWTHVGGHSGQ
jgi:hypothetical protein